MTVPVKRIGCLVSLAVTLVSAPPALAKQADRDHTVAGTWQTLVPVTLTSYQPSASDPTTGTYTGVGSTLWQGTWTGVTHYSISGTANLVTGAGSGTLTETFIGRATDAGQGTLDFTETYTLDTAGHLLIRARIIGGTGDFHNAKGAVRFEGMEIGIVTGNGTYSGRWKT